MPVDPGTGVRPASQPPPVPKKKQGPLPVPAASPYTPPRVAAPSGPPAPILHQHGIGSVQELNDKTQALVDAHVKATGVKPSPALAFDVIRSPLDPALYPDMFKYPTIGHAKNAALIGPNPQTSDQQLVDLFKHVKTSDELDAIFQPENHDLLNSALDDPATARQVRAGYAQALKRIHVTASGHDIAALQESVLPIHTGWVNDVINEAALAGAQITTGLLLGPPTLAVAEGGAIAKSVSQRCLAPLAHENVKLGKGIAKGVKQDVTDPKANPGNLILDVFGLLSAGAGGVARISRAAAALRAGEGVGSAAVKLASRPTGGTAELRSPSGGAENQLLTENSLLRPAQRLLVNRRNAGMARRANPDPGGAIGINVGERLQNTLDLALDPLKANFSSENKVGREGRVRRRIDIEVQMSLKRDLDVVAGWSQTASKAYQRINQRLPERLRGLTVGEQKAIDVLSLDDPTPFDTWRRFHENMLDLDVGDAKAHRAQLAALKLAAEAIKNPRPRFRQALELTREVVAEQQRIKADDLGLTLDTLNKRIVGEAEFVRRAGEATSPGEVAGIAKPSALGDVRARFEGELSRNKKALLDEYESRFGNEVNTDNARDLSPEYAASRESRAANSNAVHEPASAIAKAYYERLLARPPAADRTVTFTAGGTGSGKSIGFASPSARAGHDIIFDTNMNKLDSAVTKIEQALKSGRNVNIVYVYRHPGDALRGMIHRAHRMGRVVPLHEHIRTHVGSSGVIRRLVKRYENDKRVTFRFEDNTGGKGQMRPVALADLPKLRHSEVANEVHTAYEAEVAAGRVEAFVHDALASEEGLGAGVRGQREPQHAGRPADPLNPDSQYIPRQRKGKSRKGVSEKLELMAPQAGKFGIPEPSLPGSLTHEFTGKSIIAGDFRIDASALAGEEYARVVRAASKLHEWRKLRDNGLEKPPDLRWYRPVRKGHAVDDQLREIVDRALDAELTTEDALHLSDVEARDLERYLYPAEYKNGQWHLLPDVDPGDVKWVDSRVLDKYRPPAPRGMKTFFQIANEPIRDVTLLYRLAYGLNAVGNVGMGLIHQGALLPPNMLRAIRAEHLYGERTARALDTLSGTSRSQSYAAVGVGEGIAKTLTTPGRVAARAWNVVTDQMFRRSAIIHELRRKAHELGLDPDNIEPLIFDKQYVKARDEAVRRGNKAMVEFDNASWFEREYLRHFVFVYPWVSRSFVWTLRTIVEHPVQTAVMNQVGREAEQEFPDVLKRAPEWFKRIGYVPIGTNSDGTPRLINPSSVNTFATLSQTLYPVAAGFTGEKYASPGDVLGPAAKFVVHGLTGKDDFGNAYPDGAWLGAAKDVLLQLPQLRPMQRKKNVPLPAVDVSDRATLVKRMNAGLKQTVFTPGWLEGYGQLIAGGLSPRGFNPDAAEARYYRDLPLEQRHKIEVGLIHKALQLQAGLLETKLPSNVKDAVDLQAQMDLVYKQKAKELGRTPTDKERLQEAIGVLQEQARIGEADVQILQKKLAKITDPNQLSRFRAGLMDKYADAKTLRQWDSDVRYVWSFRPEVLKGKLAALKQEKLIPSAAFPADQETLFGWGRKALAYRQEATQRTQEITAAQGTSQAPALEAEYRAWTDLHDKPVTVNGHRFPSPVRMEWANTLPQDRAAHIASLASASWSHLTNFDKELVGRKPPEAISQAWSEVIQAVDAYKQKNPGASIQSDQMLGLAKQVDRDPRYRGFLKDYLYSREPRIRRFEQTTPYQHVPEKQAFEAEIAQPARLAAKAILSGNYSAGEVRAAWRSYIETEVTPWLDNHKQLKAFLSPYGVSFLTGLVSR